MSIFRYRVPKDVGDLNTLEERVRRSGFQVPRWWIALAHVSPKIAAVIVLIALRTGVLMTLTRLGVFHAEGRQRILSAVTIVVSLSLLALLAYIVIAMR